MKFVSSFSTGKAVYLPEKNHIYSCKRRCLGLIMQLFLYISDFIVPFLILAIVVYGVLMGVNVYDTFIKGAKGGFLTVIKIMPTLIGLMVAVGILRASGFLDFLAGVLGGLAAAIHLPPELMPLVLVRMFSASAANGLAADLFREFGPDSFIGRTASLIMSSTETIFYTLSVYCMTVKVKKTRWTLPGALLAMGVGVIVSVILAERM